MHCLEILIMNKEAFLNLCDHFQSKGWLKNSRYITVEEKMAMYRTTLSHNVKNRFVK